MIVRATEENNGNGRLIGDLKSQIGPLQLFFRKKRVRNSGVFMIITENQSGFQDRNGGMELGRKRKERPVRPHETRPFTQDTVFFARLWYLGRCGGCKALRTLSVRQIAKLLHRSPQNIREAIGEEWLRPEDRC